MEIFHFGGLRYLHYREWMPVGFLDGPRPEKKQSVTMQLDATCYQALSDCIRCEPRSFPTLPATREPAPKDEGFILVRSGSRSRSLTGF